MEEEEESNAHPSLRQKKREIKTEPRRIETKDSRKDRAGAFYSCWNLASRRPTSPSFLRALRLFRSSRFTLASPLVAPIFLLIPFHLTYASPIHTRVFRISLAPATCFHPLCLFTPAKSTLFDETCTLNPTSLHAVYCGLVRAASPCLSLSHRKCVSATSTQTLGCILQLPVSPLCFHDEEKERHEERKRDDDRKKEVSAGRRDVGKRFSNALALYISVVRPFFHEVSPCFRGFPRFSVLLVSRDISCWRLAPRTDQGQ